GWHMLRLPLWGWWPLLFNLSLWLTGVMLFFPKDAIRKKWLGAATLSGVLLGIGFPPSPLTFVVIFAMIPLLAVENGIYQREERTKPGQVFLFSLHAFVLWNVIATFWVTNTAFVAGLFANYVNAVLMACVMVLIHIFSRRLPPRLFTLIFISFWIAFEYLHHQWDTSWPWLTLGNSMAEYPWAIQWYEFTGIFGGSLWILGLNLLGYAIIMRWLRAKPLKIYNYILLLVIPLIVSALLWIKTKPSDAQPVSVVVVQPNFEPHFEKFDIPQSQQSLRFQKLSKEILDSNDYYLVFPETSFEGVQLNAFRENKVIDIFQKLIDQYPHLHLVAGLSSYRILTADELEGSNVRIHKNGDGNETYWDIQNSAVQMTSGLESFQVYFKSKFVPGPEIFPYKKYLFFLKPIVEKLGGSYEGHTSQKERSVFTGGPLIVAPIICYESVYGNYTGEYVRKGATAFFIITNDGWWDVTPGHTQHLKLGALRAIEHRRPIARSANSGTSCFINIKGQILQPTRYGEATAIRGQIIPETRLTFYTKYGDVIAISAAIITIIILLAGFAMMIRKRIYR
ncbi:MAG TPA: apolipoprotein N-acyltransferase, partial [Saprospiraceae bacterium]|nr:apolipoprotein N-acyltransferase [Saprospiraceae bacterium]